MRAHLAVMIDHLGLELLIRRRQHGRPVRRRRTALGGTATDTATARGNAYCRTAYTVAVL